MPVCRGTVYAYDDSAGDNFGVLILTRDSWNDSRMQTVVVAPIGSQREPATLISPIVQLDGPCQARVGEVIEFPKHRLHEALFTLYPDDLARVESGLCELLLLRHLCGPNPRAPLPPAGPSTYPQWGEIYFSLGEEHEGNRKRRVVVSDSRWNRISGRALAIRTTTSPRRRGPAFPVIESGAARACCASLTAFSHAAFSRQRPHPPRLSLSDMVAIAKEIVDVLDLEAALER